MRRGNNDCTPCSGLTVPAGDVMRLRSGQIAIVRSPALRLLAVVLLIGLVVLGGGQTPHSKETKHDRFKGALAANLTSGTDPQQPTCFLTTLAATAETTAVP